MLRLRPARRSITWSGIDAMGLSDFRLALVIRDAVRRVTATIRMRFPLEVFE
jgi:hypothetical protein